MPDRVSEICKERHSLEPQAPESLCRESRPEEVGQSLKTVWEMRHKPKGNFPPLPAEGSVVQRTEEGLVLGAWASSPDCLEVAVICVE